jgi:cell division protein ZapA
MEKHRVVVSIFGKEYGLLSEVDPEYIKKAAEYLDSKMREVAESYPNVTETRAAVLAALNIADELFRSTENLQGSSEMEKKISAITRKLSDAL